MRRVLSTLVFTMLAGSRALAGPVDLFPEVRTRPFPLTSGLWQSVLGSGRDVELTRDGARRVTWHVTFLSKEGARFDEARGVLELASAPAHCDGPALAVELGDHPEPDFWPLRRQLCSTVREGGGCHVLTEEDDADALVAHFSESFGLEMASIVAAPERCETIRAHCVADPSLAGRLVVSDDGDYMLSSGLAPGYRRTIACAQVDEAIQACREAEVQWAQQAERDIAREGLCRGLLIPTLTASGAIEVRVVGADGATWAEKTVRMRGSPVPARVWVLTPLAVVADVPIMLVMPFVDVANILWWRFKPR
jgi:hypothetical protein